MPCPRFTLVALLWTAAAVLGAPSSFRITTVAGTNFVGDGGTAAAATLSSVEGLAADAAGNLYIADSTDHRIRRVDRQGGITTVAGNGSAGFRGDGGAAAQAILNSPYGIAVDAAGNLLVADYGNRRVRRIGVDGSIRTVAGGADAAGVQFLGPRNVALDSAGNLFVSDYADHRIYRIAASDGRVTVVAGTGVSGHNGDGAGVATQLSFPAGLAVDRNGALLVADSGNKAVRRISNGQVTTILGGAGSPVNLGTPVGLAFDRDGNLYIADSSAKRIYRLSANGAVSTVVDAITVRDVAVDLSGTVCFGGARQVWKAGVSGAPAALAGNGSTVKIVENADARLTALQGPMGVAVDSSGQIYIAEERTSRVRRVSAGGLIQTVAGGGLPTGASNGDGGPATQARLVDPVAVAWDPVAGLRVVDYLGNRVRGLLPNGNIYTVAGDGEPGFRGDLGPASQARINRPRGAAFDLDGNLYVADSFNHRIRKIGASGLVTTVAGSGVRGYLGDGGRATEAHLNAPQGVAVDSAGQIYIADSGNHAIRRVSPDGIISTVAGTGIRGYAGDGVPAALAALNSPAAVAVDADGLLLVADTFNHRVRRVTAAGSIETIAGDGTAGYWGDDGPAALAQLNSPAGLAVDAAGRVYVADLDNNRVRLLTATGEAAPADVSSPAPAALTVMNAASLRAGPVAPGMIASLVGAGIGGPDQVVQVDGVVAAILFAGPGQINIEVPRALLAAKADVAVEARRMADGAVVAATRVEPVAAQPALFTTAQGVGQAVALNEDGSLNSADNPAARGGVVTLFGTGEGLAEPALAVQVHVGTAQGEVLAAGRAPGLAGVFQVKVKLPGLFTAPGVRPLTLTVGGVASQPGVTIVAK